MTDSMPEQSENGNDGPGPGRRFLEAVPDALAFLTEEYGMQLVVSEHLGPGAAHARFEGPSSAVDAWHDPRAEIDIYVSQDADDRLGLASLLLYVGAPDAPRYGGVYSSSKEPVDRVLGRLAEGLRTYAGLWLQGDDAAFEKLRSYTWVESGLVTQRYTRDARPGTMQQRIERAWRAAEWDKLILLLESLPEPLSAAEQLALAYARLREE
jgi:hypothetical protein